MSLDSYLVGSSREDSLIPQIWDQPLTDERKTRITVAHALSMTSGHETREPWLAPTTRRAYPGYSGAMQMYEYCFGWWRFDDVPDHHTLRFEPGSQGVYTNVGYYVLGALIERVSGHRYEEYVVEHVLDPLGMTNTRFEYTEAMLAHEGAL